MLRQRLIGRHGRSVIFVAADCMYQQTFVRSADDDGRSAFTAILQETQTVNAQSTVRFSRTMTVAAPVNQNRTDLRFEEFLLRPGNSRMPTTPDFDAGEPGEPASETADFDLTTGTVFDERSQSCPYSGFADILGDHSPSVDENVECLTIVVFPDVQEDAEGAVWDIRHDHTVASVFRERRRPQHFEMCIIGSGSK